MGSIRDDDKISRYLQKISDKIKNHNKRGPSPDCLNKQIFPFRADCLTNLELSPFNHTERFQSLRLKKENPPPQKGVMPAKKTVFRPSQAKNKTLLKRRLRLIPPLNSGLYPPMTELTEGISSRKNSEKVSFLLAKRPRKAWK